MRFLILGIAFCFVLAGDYLSKRWTLEGGPRLAALSYLSYSVVTALWFFLLRANRDLSKSAVLWVTSGMLASIVLGTVVFDESLSAANKMGILLSILGIVLVSL